MAGKTIVLEHCCKNQYHNMNRQHIGKLQHLRKPPKSWILDLSGLHHLDLQPFEKDRKESRHEFPDAVGTLLTSGHGSSSHPSTTGLTH